MSPNFDAVGYGTTLFLSNIGTMFFIIATFPLLMFIKFGLSFFRKYQRVRLWVKSLDEFLYWNGTLRMLLESYTVITISAFINFTDLTWGSYGGVFRPKCHCNTLTAELHWLWR